MTVLKRNTKLKERLNPALALDNCDKVVPLLKPRYDDKNEPLLNMVAEEKSSYKK